MKNIYHAVNKRKFTKVGNDLVNRGLSGDCIVIMTEYLLKTDDFIISKKYITNKYNWGKSKTDRAFDELIEKGHIVRFKVKRTAECPAGVQYCLYEEPIEISF
jgi:hypothetical protein